MKPDELLEMARGTGLGLSLEQAEKLVAHAARMLEHNRRVNLTSITDPREVMVKHIIDSLTPLAPGPTVSLWDEPATVVDVGPGAGYPGVPLAVLCPEHTFAMVEATRKKADFIRAVVRELRLDNVRVHHARAEELGRDDEYREHFDLALGRGVADLAVLGEYLLPLVKVGGTAIAYKGPGVETELEAARVALDRLGGGRVEPVELELPAHGGKRVLVYITKSDHTPARYPRRPGIPSKRPIGP